METDCIICGGRLVPGVRAPRSSYAAAGAYRIDICSACGAGTTLPRPTERELAAHYDQSYGYGAHDLIEAEKRRRAAWLLRWSGVGAGRVLDVGCMFGFLLDEARKLGLETHGIELAGGPAGVARSKGHEVSAGTIEQYAAAHPERRFDAIFAQHVLEHVTDPWSFVASAREMLVAGGQLVICVPNFGARLRALAPRSWGWYQVPVHLVHYSRQALERLLREAGFAVGDVRTRGGDTLFLALTALQSLGLASGAASTSSRQPALARAMLGVLGQITRPYVALADDELAVIARREAVV
jgi:2-polyprenyl-3-methyl-5-hydroxy-6-metoxy-1,4-benzoquinol methylase